VTVWRTRLAPTPSGFLHEGNALNFLLIQHLKKTLNAHIILRIDDLDKDRVRDQYIEDIFKTLDWLEILPDEAPGSVEEFKNSYSQSLRHSLYLNGLNELKLQHKVFACVCSRRQLGNGLYPGTCREKNIDQQRPHCWRYKSDDQGELGDFIVWTKQDQAAYQLASMVDDNHYGINLIIRGQDLQASTQAQLLLKERIYPQPEIKVFHHQLITQDGEKLSKSQLHHQDKPLRERYSSLSQLKAFLGLEEHLQQLDLFIDRSLN
jgi:glutamyl/glutaminyl-tRNA synthetase